VSDCCVAAFHPLRTREIRTGADSGDVVAGDADALEALEAGGEGAEGWGCALDGYEGYRGGEGGSVDGVEVGGCCGGG
jgi:hypothetical protein